MRGLASRMRRREDGVASTVGTLMALLVFLTFLSLITNQYVPVYMKDSEASHANEAIGQFSALKGVIDLQALAAQSGGAEYVPVTAATAVTLGLDGVPIFSSPTNGRLAANPDAGPFTVAFDYFIRSPSGGDFRTRVNEQSNGSISLEMFNRFYVPQTIAYENGAVIRTQQDGQVMRAPGTFLVTRNNGTVQIRFDLTTLYGRGELTGTGTEVVNTRLFASDVQTYDRFPSNAVIWINHTSAHGLAWYHFLNTTLADSMNLAGTYTSTPLDKSFVARVGGEVAYRITVTFIPTTRQYITRLEIHNTAMLPLDEFRLRHNQVQVGLGEPPSAVLK